MVKKYKRRKRRIRRGRKKIQKGGFGGAMALGMLVPQLLGTVGQVLKINV